MTLAQSIFLAAFTFVGLAIVATSAVVVANMRRIDGGTRMTGRLLVRLSRLPASRTEVNRWAFYAHRLTGIAIFGFLCLHIVDVSLFTISHELYDEVHQLYGTAPMRVFEVGLLAALLFHALNGLRIIAIDTFDLGIEPAARVLTGVVIATAVLTVAGGIIIIKPVFT